MPNRSHTRNNRFTEFHKKQNNDDFTLQSEESVNIDQIIRKNKIPANQNSFSEDFEIDKRMNTDQMKIKNEINQLDDQFSFLRDAIKEEEDKLSVFSFNERSIYGTKNFDVQIMDYHLQADIEREKDDIK